MAQAYSAWVATVGLGCLLVCAPASAEDARQAVEAGNRAFIAAFLRGDAAAVADRYTENAQVIAPGAPIATGRAAIAEFWQNSIASGIKDVTLETTEVESEGNLAYETGVVRLVSNEGATTAARYVVVWKRIGERWLLHRDIWNSAE
jgi:uncharacterized protein (TIGR02246 family)